MKNPTAIFCSDIHLRETIPECRKETFFDEMMDKLNFISDLQKEYGIPVINAGDLFHHWKASPELLIFAMLHLPKEFHSIVGQHDLPNHNYNFINKSGFGVLKESKFVRELERMVEINCDRTLKDMNGFFTDGFPFGSELPKRSRRASVSINEEIKVAVCHTLTWLDKEPFPDAKGNNAPAMLQRFPNYQLVVTGDNHQQFIYHNSKGQVLLNPGSMMRTSIDQKDFEPAVFLWDYKTNKVEKVPLPINKKCFLTESREIKSEREDRMNSFIKRLKGQKEIGLSFEKNMEEFISSNNIDKKIKEMIWEVCDED